jgi:hypothetical protein
VTIVTSVFALIAILMLLWFALAGLSARPGDHRWARQRDRRRTLRAALALDADPVLSRQALEVDVHDDTVVLRGWVESPHARDAAVALVRRLPGIRHVLSEIAVVGARRGLRRVR